MAERLGRPRQRPSETAVLDSGPLIHLREIGALSSLSIFDLVFVAPEVREEAASTLKTLSKAVSKRLGFVSFSGRDKDFSRALSETYGIDLAEAQAIVACKNHGVGLLLSDDLQARTVAKSLGIEVHGTIGIVLRAFRKGVFSKKEAVLFVKSIPDKSSLFITSDLVEMTLREIEKFEK